MRLPSHVNTCILWLKTFVKGYSLRISLHS
jgi:hypothetical protein